MHDSNTTYGFRIHSLGLLMFFRDVIGLPCGKKYSTLRIPQLFKTDNKLKISFIRGLADTDFCISLKRGSRKNPFYPVISGSSKSKEFMSEIADELEHLGIHSRRYFDYIMKDTRLSNGFSIINRIEINRHDNVKRWMQIIGFKSPKHLKKAEKASLL